MPVSSGQTRWCLTFSLPCAELLKVPKQQFYMTIKAYCLYKNGKQSESKDLLAEIKATGNRDPVAIKYHSFIYTELQQNDKAVEILEGGLNAHPQHRDLGDQLFFAYVRSNEKLLKQQNKALDLYKEHQDVIYAQWAVESMFHISLSLKFKTKILDIAYLLLLKLMKEPGFEVDYHFVRLYIKVLAQQGKYKEALDFMGLQ